MMEFERKLTPIIPPYHVIKKAKGSNPEIYLKAIKNNNKETESIIVSTNKNGGFIDQNYAVFFEYDELMERDFQAWYVNPFRFFSSAFDLELRPIPDTTTVNGNRIYYSHIDGDGYNNRSFVEAYRQDGAFSTEVIMEEVIKAYPHLPVSVAVIAADVDVNWVGSEEIREATRELLALPNVEVAHHTYSHPFEWGFFEDYTTEKEKPFLKKYQGRNWGDGSGYSTSAKEIPTAKDLKGDHGHNHSHGEKKKLEKSDGTYEIKDIYEVPRAFAVEPYDLEKEIIGAKVVVKELAPEGKPLNIVMWSGDTSPYEAALRVTREAGLLNINGGDSRFDPLFNSYSWVSPLSRQVGNERQVYASSSNENTYTNLWRGPYHGFRYLRETAENTETPIRIKPYNVYYHMYSGDYYASLEALKYNVEYANEKVFTPIKTSQFAEIVNGFFSANINKLGNNTWSISNRGKLQTIRFDNASDKKMRFSRSKGVIGQKHYQGSLYVYLDEAVKKPVISLTKHEEIASLPTTYLPYIVDSTWNLKNVSLNKKSLKMDAYGYGQGKINIKMPKQATYQVKLLRNQEVKQVFDKKTDENQLLALNFSGEVVESMTIEIKETNE
jgi:hypothetical protein